MHVKGISTLSIDEKNIQHQSPRLRTYQKVCETQVFFENQLLDYKKAAQYLGICESYLRRLKSKRKISFVEIGVRGVRFKVASLNKWIEEREIKK
ncbi:helix-turn-helix transcriptional regulator [Bdellovibrio sp. HCB337]|uniref:helix-turn-helix transcriptional regulator n=1 Tax=Bdellovibrio sp. HCB337 TaxID=3394358 RepID=UPI0039A44DE0